MNVTKCDNCEKEIKGKSARIGRGFWSGVDLCVDCGMPALKLLEKFGFSDENKTKKIKNNAKE